MSIKEDLIKKVDLKTKPVGSLGILEKIAIQVGEIQQSLSPELKRPAMLVFAGDHGLTEEGVSLFPKEVTYQMVMNFLNGGAAINVFCKQNNFEIKVIDAGVDFNFNGVEGLIHAKIGNGTKNMLKEKAMSVQQCSEAMTKGAELVRQEFEKGSNVIGFGEMGIGNTSSAALLMHKFTGIKIEECSGPGTGLDAKGVSQKVKVLSAVTEKYQTLTDPKEILAAMGGFEIAMMTGAFLEAARLDMIILVDGFISTSALMAASEMDKNVVKNCIFSHQSKEPGHQKMLNFLGAETILNSGLRLGEGTGAVLAYPMVEAAVNFLNEMASFEDAGVSNL